MLMRDTNGRIPAQRQTIYAVGLCLCAAIIQNGSASAAAPNPVLNSVFPPGASVGSTVEVTIAGAALDELVATT